MTDLLRKALTDSESLRRVSIDTGLDRASIRRFRDGEASLRLDLADKLAAYFGIESTRKGK